MGIDTIDISYVGYWLRTNPVFEIIIVFAFRRIFLRYPREVINE